MNTQHKMSTTNVELPCTVAECGYKTPALPIEHAFQQMTFHRTDAHQTAVAAPPTRTHAPRPPKVDRPPLRDNLDEVGWNAFIQDWEMFVRANNISVDDRPIQLLSCCDGILKGKVNATCADIYTKSVIELMTILKSLAVIPVAVVVKRNELLKMYQNAGEKIRTYHSRLKAQAAICRFKVKCPHEHENDVLVDYTNEMIHHVLLNGLYDDEIKTDISSLNGLDTMSVSDLVSTIEAKETARDAVAAQSNNAITQYRRQQKEKQLMGPNNHQNTTNTTKQEGKCSVCKTPILLYKKMRSSGKLNRKPFTECIDCYKQLKSNNDGNSNDTNAISFHVTSIASDETVPLTSSATPDRGPQPKNKGKARKKRKKVKMKTASDTPATEVDSPETPSQPASHIFMNGKWVTRKTTSLDLSSVEIKAKTPAAAFAHHVFEGGDWIETPNTAISTVQSMDEPSLSHHIFANGKWIRKSAPSHPVVDLAAYTDQDDYSYFGFENPEAHNIHIKAIVDSGAQCCVWSWRECQQAGFTRDRLIPVRQKLNAVSRNTIRIYGAVVLRMFGTTSEMNACQPAVAIVYVSPDVTGFYLSNEAMKQLLIVPESFPAVGGAMADVGALQHASKEEQCSCSQRTPPPGLPEKLPFDPDPANIPKMRDYIVNRYLSSTFNKCPHHPIPIIPGPPISIHIDPDATPVSCSVLQAPLHFYVQTKYSVNSLFKMYYSYFLYDFSNLI